MRAPQCDRARPIPASKARAFDNAAPMHRSRARTFYDPISLEMEQRSAALRLPASFPVRYPTAGVEQRRAASRRDLPRARQGRRAGNHGRSTQGKHLVCRTRSHGRATSTQTRHADRSNGRVSCAGTPQQIGSAADMKAPYRVVGIADTSPAAWMWSVLDDRGASQVREVRVIATSETDPPART